MDPKRPTDGEPPKKKTRNKQKREKLIFIRVVSFFKNIKESV